MNIHISEEHHEILKHRTIAMLKMGSHLYGLANEHSDQDYLCIYTPTLKEITSPVDSFHQLQYKDEVNNIDYVYTSLPNFFRNLMSGDSTINFEVLFNPLFNMYLNCQVLPSSFVCYNLIKSYVGMARRDMKYVTKMPSEREKWNKLAHIVRGVYTAELLLNGNFRFDIFKENHDLFKTLKMLKNQDGRFYGELSQNIIVEYTLRMDNVRLSLTKKLSDREIHPVPEPQIVNDINSWIAANMDRRSLDGDDSYLVNYYMAAHYGIKY